MFIAEDQEQLKEMTDSYKEEKQQRKNLTHKINQLNEEIADLKVTNETLEKVKLQSFKLS